MSGCDRGLEVLSETIFNRELVRVSSGAAVYLSRCSWLSWPTFSLQETDETEIEPAETAILAESLAIDFDFRAARYGETRGAEEFLSGLGLESKSFMTVGRIGLRGSE